MVDNDAFYLSYLCTTNPQQIETSGVWAIQDMQTQATSNLQQQQWENAWIMVIDIVIIIII